jgi:hypothetical protein
MSKKKQPKIPMPTKKTPAKELRQIIEPKAKAYKTAPGLVGPPERVSFAENRSKHSVLCRIGWHTWTKWKIIQVQSWVSFLPRYDNSTYGMYLKSNTSYNGPAGQFVERNMQQRECSCCGKTQRISLV